MGLCVSFGVDGFVLVIRFIRRRTDFVSNMAHGIQIDKMRMTEQARAADRWPLPLSIGGSDSLALRHRVKEPNPEVSFRRSPE